jgi:3-methyladenine DNA glycosylase AlkC
MSPEDLIKSGPSKVEPEVKPIEQVVELEEVSPSTITDIDETPFDLSKFDSSAEKPKEPVKPVEKPSDEPVVEEKKPETTLTTKPEDKPTEEFVPTPIQRKTRDFTGLDDQEAAFAKQMSNPAFEVFKARAIEAKKYKEEVKQLNEKLAKTGTSNAIPDSYYEHEQGFLLDPTYQQSVSAVRNLEAETLYWQEQLKLCKEGEDWTNLEMGANGQLVQTKVKANADGELYLQKQMAKADRLYDENNRRLQSVVQNHKTRHAQTVQGIKKFEQDFFNIYDDKFFESNKYGKGMQALLSKVGQQSNPLAGVVCKLYAYAMEVVNDNKLEEEKKGKKISEEVRKSTGPSTSEITNGKGAKVASDSEDAPFDLSKFESRLR